MTIDPFEIALVFSLVLLPPLLICLAVQFLYFWKKLQLTSSSLWIHTFFAGVTVYIFSFLGLVVLLPIDFGQFNRLLGLRLLDLGGRQIEVMPLAWIVATLMAVFVIMTVTMKLKKNTPYYLALPFVVVPYSIVIASDVGSRIFEIFPLYVVTLGSGAFFALSDGLTLFFIYGTPALLAWLGALVWGYRRVTLSIIGWVLWFFGGVLVAGIPV